MKHNDKAPSVLVGLLLTCASVPGYAQDDAVNTQGAPTRAEFNKLQAEVREQRSLIIQMLQTEQQRYDMLLRLMQSQNGGPPVALPTPASPEAPAAAESAPAAKKGRASAAAEIEKRLGSVEGKVTVSGGDVGEIYVYVDNVRSPPVRNKTV